MQKFIRTNSSSRPFLLPLFSKLCFALFSASEITFSSPFFINVLGSSGCSTRYDGCYLTSIISDKVVLMSGGEKSNFFGNFRDLTRELDRTPSQNNYRPHAMSTADCVIKRSESCDAERNFHCFPIHF